MALNWLLEPLSDAAIFLGLDTLLKRGTTVVGESLVKKMEVNKEHRAQTWNFIEQMEDVIARDYLMLRHRQAFAARATDPRAEDRLSDLLTVIYVATPDDAARTAAFSRLGHLRGKRFEQALVMVESHPLTTWLLLVKKYGGYTITAIKDFMAERTPGMKSVAREAWDIISAEVEERPGSYRDQARLWMRTQTEMMHRDHEARLARGDEETYTTRRGDAEIVHHHRRVKGWVIVSGILLIWLIVSSVVAWFAS